MNAATHPCATPCTDQVQAQFLLLVPKLKKHARIAFRHWRCPLRKEEALQECVALAWKWFRRLHERGKDVNQFPMVFIDLVAKAVKAGRRLCGQEHSKDVMSYLAQYRHGFHVEGLPGCERRPHQLASEHVNDLEVYEERLRDNTLTPPAEGAAFRIDFPQFLAGLTARDRALALFLSLGNGINRAADRFGVSVARVSQLRKRWHRDWQVFQGDVESGGVERSPEDHGQPGRRVKAASGRHPSRLAVAG